MAWKRGSHGFMELQSIIPVATRAVPCGAATRSLSCESVICESGFFQDVAKACCLKILGFSWFRKASNIVMRCDDDPRPDRLPPLEWHREQLAQHGWQVCEVISELRWEAQVLRCFFAAF